MLIIGCNTVGHLGAGIFDCQRTGDDTSGRGLGAHAPYRASMLLAFRLPQNESFFTVDADCVAITQAIPWRKRDNGLIWLRAVKTALFISPARNAIGVEQKKALAEAFAIVIAQGLSATPSDWFGRTRRNLEQWWRKARNTLQVVWSRGCVSLRHITTCHSPRF